MQMQILTPMPALAMRHSQPSAPLFQTALQPFPESACVWISAEVVCVCVIIGMHAGFLYQECILAANCPFGWGELPS